VLRVLKVTPEQLGRSVKQVPLVLKVFKVFREFRASRVTLELLVPQVLKEIRA
jgi:hypothetical protein